MVRSLPLACAATLAGCSPEYAFVPVATPDDGSAVSVAVDARSGIRSEVFEAGDGATTQVADFLFVIDNSVSMKKVLDRVRAGLATLSAEAFPARSRVAVMSTLPSALGDPSRPHPIAADVEWLEYDPGFLGFVDAARVRRLRVHAPAEVASAYPEEACEGWFSPQDTNAEGVPCLQANTQVALAESRVEAGLLAFKQLLLAQPEPVFRDGAAVNVVFVSDTHDPGLPDSPARDALIAARPTAAQLDRMVRGRSDVASFRIHAIAPRAECVEVEAWADIGPSYFDAADASGGLTLDVCTATDYRPLLTDVASVGAAIQHPVLRLSASAGEVLSVEVGGRAVSYHLGRGGTTIVLDERPSERVTVTYAPRPLPRGSPSPP